MPTINISQPTGGLSAADVQQALQPQISALVSTLKSQFDVDFSFTWNADGTANFTALYSGATAFDGQLVVGPQSVDVVVNVSLLARSKAGQIESSLRDALAQAFPAPAAPQAAAQPPPVPTPDPLPDQSAASPVYTTPDTYTGQPGSYPPPPADSSAQAPAPTTTRKKRKALTTPQAAPPSIPAQEIQPMADDDFSTDDSGGAAPIDTSGTGISIPPVDLSQAAAPAPVVAPVTLTAPTVDPLAAPTVDTSSTDGTDTTVAGLNQQISQIGQSAQTDPITGVTIPATPSVSPSAPGSVDLSAQPSLGAGSLDQQISSLPGTPGNTPTLSSLDQGMNAANPAGSSTDWSKVAAPLAGAVAQGVGTYLKGQQPQQQRQGPPSPLPYGGYVNRPQAAPQNTAPPNGYPAGSPPPAAQQPRSPLPGAQGLPPGAMPMSGQGAQQQPGAPQGQARGGGTQPMTIGAPPSASGGMSTGAIAALVGGALLIVTVGGVAVWAGSK